MGYRVGGRYVEGLDHLGSGLSFAEQINVAVRSARVFSELSPQEAGLLSGFLDVFRVRTGEPFIVEGDEGSFMVLVLNGKVDVYKDFTGPSPKHVAVVGGGKTLGEMSMIDGEPRFATCVAAEDTTFAILDRDRFRAIIAEQPVLASKIMLHLVVLLNQRLRQVTARLMECMEAANGSPKK